MQVLLINTNGEKSPQTLIPLGVCYIASSVQAHGHDVAVLDLCFARRPSGLTRALRRLQPEVISLSVRNLDNCDYSAQRSYLPEIAELIAACHRASDSAGGAGRLRHRAITRRARARYLGCEIAIPGEGEVIFPKLLDALARGEDPATVPGVVVVRGEEVQFISAAPIADLDALPDPAVAHWLNLRRYRAFGASYPLQTKRGCAQRCRYCSYPHLEGAHWRLRDPERVAAEVAQARGTRLPFVEFVDSVFGLPAEHAIACCEAIARNSETDGVGDDGDKSLRLYAGLVRAMNAAGFSLVGISAESGADTILARLGKEYTRDDLARAADAAARCAPAACGYFSWVGRERRRRQCGRPSVLSRRCPTRIWCSSRMASASCPARRCRRNLIEEQRDRPRRIRCIKPIFYYSPRISLAHAIQMFDECDFPQANMASRTMMGGIGSSRWCSG